MTERCDRCCLEHELQQYLREELDGAEETHVREHLDDCATCRLALERTAGTPAHWAEVRDGLRTGTEQVADHDRLRDHLAPSEDPSMLGRLGRYEVVGLVGQGSTGTVVKALDPQLNRYVAIKILSPVYAGNGIARQRFRREARSIAAVSHEHVIPVHAVDEHAGLPFMVMPYASAGSLLQRIVRGGPLGNCEVVRIGMQVARGLAAAHQQGIVHRDVKPANVMLEDGVDRAMVTDFGLARVADDAAMTRSGVIAGTPQFMSPEQAQGLPVDPRSDLFSLGSTLYMAATGREPFRSDTVFGVIKKVCEHEPTPIRELNPEIAPWLAAFVQRLMYKDRGRRFDSATEVAELLEGELAHQQNPTVVAEPDRPWLPGAARSPQPWWARRSAAAAAIAVAGVGLGLTYGLTRTDLDANAPSLGGAELVRSASFDSILGIAPLTRTSFDAEDAAVATVEYQQRFPLPESRKLVFTGSFESVEIRTRPSDEIVMDVSLRVDADTRDLAAEIAGHHDIERVRGSEDLDLRSRTDPMLLRVHRINPIQSASIVFTVPEGFDLDLATDSGDVAVDDRGGDLELETNSGAVALGAIRGDVRLRTDSSRASATLGRGDLEAHSATGELQLRVLRSSRGNVLASTESGPIQVVLIDGVQPEIEARTETGSVMAQGGETTQGIWRMRASGPAPELEIVTGSGGISVLQASGETASEPAFGGYPSWPEQPEDASVEAPTMDEPIVEERPDEGAVGEEPEVFETEIDREGGSTPNPGNITTVTHPFSGGVLDAFNVYLPPSHDVEGDRYPVILYLPGGCAVGCDLNDLADYGLPSWRLTEFDPEWQQEATNERDRLAHDTFVIVTPHLTEGDYDDRQFFEQEQAIDELLDLVLSRFHGDPSRIYLCGTGRGGHGAWGLADRMPQRFAAAVSIRGHVHGVADGEGLASLPLWIGHGKDDGEVPAVNALRMARRIEGMDGKGFLRLGTERPENEQFLAHDRIFTLLESDDWPNLFASEHLYRWLLQHRRTEIGTVEPARIR